MLEKTSPSAVMPGARLPQEIGSVESPDCGGHQPDGSAAWAASAAPKHERTAAKRPGPQRMERFTAAR